MRTEIERLRAENKVLKDALANRQQLPFIDATPNKGYPLRILEACLARTSERWSSTTSGSEEDEDNPLCLYMSDLQTKRAALLTQALETLRRRSE